MCAKWVCNKCWKSPFWDFPGISVHKFVILLSVAGWMDYWLDRFNIGLFWIILRDNGNSSPSVLYHNLSNRSIHNNICCWLQYSYNGSVAKNKCKEDVLQTNYTPSGQPPNISVHTRNVPNAMPIYHQKRNLMLCTGTTNGTECRGRPEDQTDTPLGQK